MLVTIIGIISIGLGLTCFGGAYMTVMHKGPAARAWAFGITGVVFLTLIPVFLAITYAVQMNG